MAVMVVDVSQGCVRPDHVGEFDGQTALWCEGGREDRCFAEARFLWSREHCTMAGATVAVPDDESS